MTGLVCAGRTFENCTAIKKACDFLLSKELPSGGWGESWLSAHNEVSFTSIYRFVHSKKKNVLIESTKIPKLQDLTNHLLACIQLGLHKS